MEGESRSVIARAALCVHITRFAATVVNAAKDDEEHCAIPLERFPARIGFALVAIASAVVEEAEFGEPENR